MKKSYILDETKPPTKIDQLLEIGVDVTAAEDIIYRLDFDPDEIQISAVESILGKKIKEKPK